MAATKRARREFVTSINNNLFITVDDIKRYFNKLIESGETISFQYRGDPQVTIISLKATYNSFILGYETIKTMTYTEYVPYTISYKDILFNEVKILTDEGNLKKHEIK